MLGYLHINIKNVRSISKSESIKYLVYECKYLCGGWADRLKGIMSVYALSLLVDRRFLIDIRSPCNFSQLFMPNKVDWRLSSSSFATTSKSKRVFKDCLNYFQPDKCLNELNSALNKSENKFLSLKANQDWLSYFSKNSHFQAKILNLGFNSTEHFQLHHVFYKFYHKLFKLTPMLEKKYEKIKRHAQLTPYTQIYCAQVRIGGARPNVKYDLKINELGRTQKLFWKFMRENFIKQDDWRVFITSDMEIVEREAIDEFGLERVIRIPGLNTHVDREHNLGNDCTRIEKPILDFHFMQMCDKAVISSSGFGRLGLWNRPNDPLKDVFVFEDNVFVPIEDFMRNKKTSSSSSSSAATALSLVTYIYLELIIFYFFTFILFSLIVFRIFRRGLFKTAKSVFYLLIAFDFFVLVVWRLFFSQNAIDKSHVSK
jgi:hypothetical protein